MSNIMLANIFGLLGSLITLCYTTPIFVVMLIPLGISYYILQD